MAWFGKRKRRAVARVSYDHGSRIRVESPLRDGPEVWAALRAAGLPLKDGDTWTIPDPDRGQPWAGADLEIGEDIRRACGRYVGNEIAVATVVEALRMAKIRVLSRGDDWPS